MSVRHYTFRDATLKSTPLQLMNQLGEVIKRVGMKALPHLEANAIVDLAIQRAQLSDFGGDSFREPLDHYLHAVAEDAHLNTFGRLAVREVLVSSMVNRLKLKDWIKHHPEVSDEKIDKPWIILGMPRTGTSLLSILLGLNPLARPLLHWEAANPMPPPDLASAGEDPRIAECAGDIDKLLQLNPALRAMHPFGAMVAQECTALFMYDLRTVGLETQAFVPGYGRWLASADMTPAYQIHKQVLQAFQAAQPTEQWVLKSPNHLWCIDTLLTTYPDARIIWTHRDPPDVVTSLASLTNTLQRPMTNHRNHEAVAEDWNRKLMDGLNKAIAFDQQAESGWCYHLRYNDMMDNPMQAIEGIFTHFDMPLEQLHRRRIAKWLEHRPKNAFGKHQYDAKDFGWTKAQLDEQYSHYRENYC